VRRAARAVIAVAVDVTEATAEDDELVARLGARGVPAVVLLDPVAQPVGHLIGGTDAEAVLDLLDRVLER
jgi:thiol:disulfide interchange protein